MTWSIYLIICNKIWKSYLKREKLLKFAKLSRILFIENRMENLH